MRPFTFSRDAPASRFFFRAARSAGATNLRGFDTPGSLSPSPGRFRIHRFPGCAANFAKDISALKLRAYDQAGLEKEWLRHPAAVHTTGMPSFSPIHFERSFRRFAPNADTGWMPTPQSSQQCLRHPAAVHISGTPTIEPMHSELRENPPELECMDPGLSCQMALPDKKKRRPELASFSLNSIIEDSGTGRAPHDRRSRRSFRYGPASCPRISLPRRYRRNPRRRRRLRLRLRQTRPLTESRLPARRSQAWESRPQDPARPAEFRSSASE